MAPVASGDNDPYGAYAGGVNSMPSRASLGQPFVVREQARDGNCLFRSFSDQLYGTPEHHLLVRDRCSKYLASERDYFEQFVAEPFDEFLTRIRKEGEWGDDVEIEALSEIYDCRVEIYCAAYSHALMRTFHEACDAKWPNPIRLQYEGHAHYNSLAPQAGLVPIANSMSGQHRLPGEIEDNALQRSEWRRQAGQRRAGAGEADREQTERRVMDESIRLSRMEFEHKSEAEMDRTLETSRVEWERSERKRMDEEVVDAMLQQSVMEEEQKQLATAMKESKEMIMHNRPDYAMLYGMIAPEAPVGARNGPGASSSSANDQDKRDSRDFQYPESVYAVMSMGFPLEKCIQAYHLVGDNPEGILAYCCQTLTR
uniref:ubiquitinyl hydrolase 1 n=1 Tax=Alexandrium monilatum TaxID=311494 RepID=A0A7S4Q7L1_9DINO